MKGKFIQITDEQENFIIDQPKSFNLSKLIRARLSDYMEKVEELKND